MTCQRWRPVPWAPRPECYSSIHATHSYADGCGRTGAQAFLLGMRWHACLHTYTGLRSYGCASFAVEHSFSLVCICAQVCARTGAQALMLGIRSLLHTYAHRSAPVRVRRLCFWAFVHSCMRTHTGLRPYGCAGFPLRHPCALLACIRTQVCARTGAQALGLHA